MLRSKQRFIQGYPTDTNVSLSCEDDYHFKDETSSTEEKLQCDETGAWKVVKDNQDPAHYASFDCKVHRCVRKYCYKLSIMTG